MEIIVNNYSKEKSNNSIKFICKNCSSELLINEDDLITHSNGVNSIICPCCRKMSQVFKEELFPITTENISYPKHFSVVNKDINKHIKDVSDKEINDEIKIGIDYLKQNKDRSFYFLSYGDTFLLIINCKEDDEYMIIVTKNFSEAFVSSLEENSLTLEK